LMESGESDHCLPISEANNRRRNSAPSCDSSADA
jgi:hypothetical protein